MRQNNGEASVNSTPISLLPDSFWPRKVIVQGSSSAVRGLTMEISCARSTTAASLSRHPWALTEIVWACSSKRLPAAVPRTRTGMLM